MRGWFPWRQSILGIGQCQPQISRLSPNWFEWMFAGTQVWRVNAMLCAKILILVKSSTLQVNIRSFLAEHIAVGGPRLDGSIPVDRDEVLRRGDSLSINWPSLFEIGHFFANLLVLAKAAALLVKSAVIRGSIPIFVASPCIQSIQPTLTRKDDCSLTATPTCSSGFYALHAPATCRMSWRPKWTPDVQNDSWRLPPTNFNDASFIDVPNFHWRIHRGLVDYMWIAVEGWWIDFSSLI